MSATAIWRRAGCAERRTSGSVRGRAQTGRSDPAIGDAVPTQPNPSASPQDISVTKELGQAAKLLGLELLDHVVIGANEAVSLKDRGLLD